MACLRDFLPPVKGPVDNDDDEVSTRTVAETAKLGENSISIAGASGSKSQYQYQNEGLSKTLTLTNDASGAPDFAAVVKQGENANKYVHATRSSLIEKPRSALTLSFPSEEDAQETEQRTRLALQSILEKKLKVVSKKDAKDSKFIKYTPANANNSGSRIIKMVTAQSDPMEPPRFSQKKAPMNPPSPPVPVLHSPERKLSKEEAAEWKVPPVVSNWKNARGYTVPLDKRLAARGEVEVPKLNNRLAEFADSLYKAERQARIDVEKRAQLQRAVSLRKQEEKQNRLENMAKQARADRNGTLNIDTATDIDINSVAGARIVHDESPPRPNDNNLPAFSVDEAPPPVPPPMAVGSVARSGLGTPRVRKSRFDIGPGGVLMQEPAPASQVGALNDDDPDDEGLRERDAIRRERREERERERRSRENRGREDSGPTLKRSKITRDRDRDVSERIALGQDASKAATSGEVMYDQRLFNQGERDAGRAFGSADAYDIYDKPLWNDRPSSSFLYRPKDGTLGNQAVPGKRRGNINTSPAVQRGDRPVEFERDTEDTTKDMKDPFGVDRFLAEASRGRKK